MGIWPCFCLYLEIKCGLDRYVGCLVDKGRTLMASLICLLGQSFIPQLFNHTLIQVLLWTNFADVIQSFNRLTLSKAKTLDNLGASDSFTQEGFGNRAEDSQGAKWEVAGRRQAGRHRHRPKEEVLPVYNTFSLCPWAPANLRSLLPNYLPYEFWIYLASPHNNTTQFLAISE